MYEHFGFGVLQFDNFFIRFGHTLFIVEKFRHCMQENLNICLQQFYMFISIQVKNINIYTCALKVLVHIQI